MFHRVKSEVQDAEHNNQQENSATYRHQDDRPAAPVSQQQDAEKTASEPSRSYSAPSSETQKNEDSHVQGKYPAEKQASPSRDRAEEEKSYQPSISRPAYAGAPSYGRSSSYAAPQTQEAAPSPAAPVPMAYTGSDRTLTIGRGINMSGEIDACDHLLVEGTVEAALKGAKVLDIAESGTFYGTVEIEEATIAGRFEGDITVNGRLTIKASGVITGSIAYRELAVEAGAMLDGRMTPIKGTVDPKAVDDYRKGTEASAMAKAKEIVGKKDNREPANTERGLFSKAHASY